MSFLGSAPEITQAFYVAATVFLVMASMIGGAYLHGREGGDGSFGILSGGSALGVCLLLPQKEGQLLLAFTAFGFAAGVALYGLLVASKIGLERVAKIGRDHAGLRGR